MSTACKVRHFVGYKIYIYQSSNYVTASNKVFILSVLYLTDCEKNQNSIFV